MSTWARAITDVAEDQTSLAGVIRGESDKSFLSSMYSHDMIVIRCVENGDCCCDYEPKCDTTSPFFGSPTAPLEEVTEEGFSLGNVTDTDTTTEQTCVSSGSCTGRCGGGSDADCWCDQDCVLTGDCCCDRELVCTSQVSQTLTLLTILIMIPRMKM